MWGWGMFFAAGRVAAKRCCNEDGETGLGWVRIRGMAKMALGAKAVSGAGEAITLAIDIGGTGLKAMKLDSQGKPVSERERVLTPEVPTPESVLEGLAQLAEKLPGFDRVSVGFPGVVKCGVTYTAVNLHPAWMGYPLAETLAMRWKVPVRVANDADLAGYGAIEGKGVELVLTLGTGLGGALFTNGHLCPGLEIGHHPWRKDRKTYEQCLGKQALVDYGRKKWNRRLLEAIAQTEALFNWDRLYLGGGNTKKIEVELPGNVTVVSNEMGLLGGVKLWGDEA